MADPLTVAPGVVVQTELDSPTESHAIYTGKTFLFDMLGDAGNRTLVLGSPISLTVEEGTTFIKTLHVSDIATGKSVALRISQIYGIFPATPEGDYFIQVCRSNMSMEEVQKAFFSYVMAAPDGRSMAALQFGKLAELEALLGQVKWAQEQPPIELSPEQQSIVAACADTLFRVAARRVGAHDHPARQLLREAALELMLLAPTVRQQWLDADAAGSELTKLRRNLAAAKNLLHMHNIPFEPPPDPSTNL